MNYKNLIAIFWGLPLLLTVCARSSDIRNNEEVEDDIGQLSRAGVGLGVAQISVTFHVTDAFRKLFINGAEMLSYIQDITSDANQGLANSQIPMQIFLQGIVSSTLAESQFGTSSGMLNAFSSAFSDLNRLRQNADIGIILVNSGVASFGDSCNFNGVYSGKTYGILNFSSKSAYNPSKFGDCLASLFGCYPHGLGPPTRDLPSTWTTYGYIWLNPMAPTNGFRTLNTYPVTRSYLGYNPAQFNIKSINYYSNPNVTYMGIPTGDAGSNDAYQISQNRFQLASIGNESSISALVSDFSQILVVSGNKTQIISLKTNSIVCTGSIPFTNYGLMAGLDFDNDPIICGDLRTSNATKTCNKLTKSKTWTQAPAPPFDNFVAGVFNPKNYGKGRMIVFGGKTSDTPGPSDKIHYFTPRGWFESSKKLPILARTGCIVSVNSTTALIITVHDSTGYLSNRTFYFDFINDILVDGPPRPRLSVNIKCARLFDPITNSVKVVAATGSFNVVSAYDVLDLKTGTWSDEQKLPHTYQAAQMFEHPSKGVILMGWYSTLTRAGKSSILYLESAISSWTALSAPIVALDTNSAATFVPDSIDCNLNNV